MSGNGDRRTRRTRGKLLAAFNQLVLGGRTRDIRVRDIVTEARVGRSTFYDHYSSAEALQLESMKRPFAPLADAAAGRGNAAAVEHILTHFWEYRQRARRSFGERTERLLAEMVEERLGDGELHIPRRLAARQLAASAHAAVSAWVAGEASSSPQALAAALCRSGEAQAAALRS